MGFLNPTKLISSLIVSRSLDRETANHIAWRHRYLIIKGISIRSGPLRSGTPRSGQEFGGPE